MRRFRLLAVTALVVTGLAVAPEGASGREGARAPAVATGGPSGLAVYTGPIDAESLGALHEVGADVHELGHHLP